MLSRRNTSPSHLAGFQTSPLNKGRSSTDLTPNLGIVKRQFYPSLLNEITENGYATLRRSMPSRYNFGALYALFDQVANIHCFEKQQNSRIKAEADAWQMMAGNQAAYAGAPMGFNDRRARTDKAEKYYFQYCREFHYYLRSHHASTYYQCPVFAAFAEKLFELSDLADGIFRGLAKELDNGAGNLSRVLFGNCGTPSILLKVLCYEPSTTWGTVPHFDKSALSLVMNTDDVERENFRIGQYRPGITTEELTAPDRIVEDGTAPGNALLFPGMCLYAIGESQIMPTPHGVLPVSNNRRRHSLIAFLLAPGIDTSAMETNSFSDLSRSFQ